MKNGAITAPISLLLPRKQCRSCVVFVMQDPLHPLASGPTLAIVAPLICGLLAELWKSLWISFPLFDPGISIRQVGELRGP
jgi:hypothetical protein